MVDGLARRVNSRLSKRDRKRNSALQSLSAIESQFDRLDSETSQIETIVDLGCGPGAFAAALGAELNATMVHGVEYRERYREMADANGLTVHDLDLEQETVPLDDGSADLVLAFGLLEHLKWYDHVLTECYRLLSNRGILWITVPNLGSYVNRLALVAGYQPRNVELSKTRAQGLLPFYPHNKPIGHVHAPTRRALMELVDHVGFDVLSTRGFGPYQDRRTVQILDYVLGWHPSLARRIAVMARRE